MGEELGKPVCATCDVHFLNPEDEVYRRILMAGTGIFRCGSAGAFISANDRRDAEGI